jgi:hypothetical protein
MTAPLAADEVEGDCYVKRAEDVLNRFEVARSLLWPLVCLPRHGGAIKGHAMCKLGLANHAGNP